MRNVADSILVMVCGTCLVAGGTPLAWAEDAALQSFTQQEYLGRSRPGGLVFFPWMNQSRHRPISYRW